MAWFKVDDGFWAHPKTFMLSDSAIALWLKSGTWASQMLTDGKIPANAVSVFRATDDAVVELVSSGLWIAAEGGYRFHDWDEYQPSADVEKSKRAARAEAARRAACVRWHGEGCGGQCEAHKNEHASTHSKTDAVEDASSDASAMPRPVPSRPVDSLRAKRLPKDWAPTSEHIARARDNNIDVMDQAENFRLHAETHDRKAKNWNAAFTTWLKKSKPQPVASSDSWMDRSGETPAWKQS